MYLQEDDYLQQNLPNLCKREHQHNAIEQSAQATRSRIDNKARIALLPKVLTIPDNIAEMAKSIQLTQQTPTISIAEAEDLADGETCTTEGQVMEVSSH